MSRAPFAPATRFECARYPYNRQYAPRARPVNGPQFDPCVPFQRPRYQNYGSQFGSYFGDYQHRVHHNDFSQQRGGYYPQRSRRYFNPRCDWRAPSYSVAPSADCNQQLLSVHAPLPLTYDSRAGAAAFPTRSGNHSSSNVGAVRSAGKSATQLFTDVFLAGVLVRCALIDTGATFSMLPSSTLAALSPMPAIESFGSSPPNIVGVGGARATVLGYVDVPLSINGIVVRHPLVVVESLPFAVLVGMDILRPHRAVVSVGEPEAVRFEASTCNVCLEHRAPAIPVAQNLTSMVATVLDDTVLARNSASIVKVRLPSALLTSQIFAVEPLSSLQLSSVSAALPSVISIVGATQSIVLVNPTSASVNLQSGTPVAAVFPVSFSQPSDFVSSAAIQHLSFEEKLSKVLSDLHFDALELPPELRLKLRALIVEFIDIFAECDSDVGTTDIVLHEIDTGDSRPLRQPARRIPYGEQRAAVESEIEKLVDAGIARPSTSPWASPVVMVKKKDGSWRMCVDYRRVNAVTKFDCFPLPRLDEALDAFAGCTVFCSLDLAMAYHQVPVDALRRRENGVHYARRPLRDGQNAFRPLQCAVNLSAPYVDRPSWTHWSHLPRISRRRDRVLSGVTSHLDDLTQRLSANSRCWPQTEAIEVSALPRRSPVPRPRHQLVRRFTRPRKAACTFYLARP